jgi:hypothetical protein
MTRKSAIFGNTVDFVLKHTPTRVMVAAGQPQELVGARP